MKLQTFLTLFPVLLISAIPAQAFSCAAGTGSPFCCNNVLAGNVLVQDVLKNLPFGPTLDADIANLVDVGIECTAPDVGPSIDPFCGLNFIITPKRKTPACCKGPVVLANVVMEGCTKAS